MHTLAVNIQLIIFLIIFSSISEFRCSSHLENLTNADIRSQRLRAEVGEGPTLEHEILLAHRDLHTTLQYEDEIVDRFALLVDHRRWIAARLVSRLHLYVVNNVLLQQTPKNRLRYRVGFEGFDTCVENFTIEISKGQDISRWGIQK